MKKSSFGFIQVCKHESKTIEYLEFYKEGRFHQHEDIEHFTVVEGHGLLITDQDSSPILEGETYKILPKTPHRMKPVSSVLKILLSYS